MSIISDLVFPASLWLIMLSMGMSLTLGDFQRIAKGGKTLAIGVLCMLVVPPLVGTVIAVNWGPTPELAFGIFLLATCPGGMLSNLLTDQAGGDLALSVSLSIFVSLIYILVIPFYCASFSSYYLHESLQINVSFLGFVLNIISITLVPIVLGMLARWCVPGVVEYTVGKVKLISTALLFASFLVIMGNQFEVLLENMSSLFGLLLLLNIATALLAFGVSCSFNLPRPSKVAIVIENIIRQEGTAIFIAINIMESYEMSIPMIINTPIALAIGIFVVLLFRTARPLT